MEITEIHPPCVLAYNPAVDLQLHRLFNEGLWPGSSKWIIRRAMNTSSSKERTIGPFELVLVVLVIGRWHAST